MQEEPPAVSQRNKDIFKTMEFTHQNLNSDFHSLSTHNKFADFMSIVDEKYESDKKKGSLSQSPTTSAPKQVSSPQNENNNGQSLNAASREVYDSMKNQASSINKIELINFFDDEPDPLPKAHHSPQPNKVSQMDLLMEEKK